MTDRDRDRDHRRVFAPPAGVLAQTAPESWEGLGTDTPPVGTIPGAASGGIPADPAETLNKMSRRIKVTAQDARDTLDSVSALRAELEVMRLAAARDEGKLAEILATLDEERKERRLYTAVGVSAYAAGVDVERQRALSQIEADRNSAAAAITATTERTAYRRQLVIKILAGIGGVWIVVSAILLATYT